MDRFRQSIWHAWGTQACLWGNCQHLSCLTSVSLLIWPPRGARHRGGPLTRAAPDEMEVQAFASTVFTLSSCLNELAS